MKKLIIIFLFGIILITAVYGQKNSILAVTRKKDKNVILYPDGTWKYMKESIKIDNEWKLEKQGSIKITKYKIEKNNFIFNTIYNNSSNNSYEKIFLKISLYNYNNKLINTKEKALNGNADPGSTKRKKITVPYKGTAPTKVTIEISKAITN